MWNNTTQVGYNHCLEHQLPTINIDVMPCQCLLRLVPDCTSLSSDLFAVKKAFLMQAICCAEDKKRFDKQLQAHPKLAALIEAYEQRRKDLKAVNKGQVSKSTKKRRRKEQEAQASDDDEVSPKRSKFVGRV